MDERRSSGACVFCGRPLEPHQERTGRGESTAHAECADRALADDAHWDRIAAQTGDRGEAPSEAPADEPAQTQARKSGCLAVASMALMLASLLLIVLG
jgi:hypothetical protein